MCNTAKEEQGATDVTSVVMYQRVKFLEREVLRLKATSATNLILEQKLLSYLRR